MRPYHHHHDTWKPETITRQINLPNFEVHIKAYKRRCKARITKLCVRWDSIRFCWERGHYGMRKQSFPKPCQRNLVTIQSWITPSLCCRTTPTPTSPMGQGTNQFNFQFHSSFIFLSSSALSNVTFKGSSTPSKYWKLHEP